MFVNDLGAATLSGAQMKQLCEGLRGNFDTKGSFVRRQTRPFTLWMTSNGFNASSSSNWTEDEYKKVFDPIEGRIGYLITTEWSIPKWMRIAERDVCRYCSARSILWLIAFAELNRSHVPACQTEIDSDIENENEVDPVYKFVSQKTRLDSEKMTEETKTINVNSEDVDLVQQFLNAMKEQKNQESCQFLKKSHDEKK